MSSEMHRAQNTDLISDKEIRKPNAVEGNRNDAHRVQEHVPFGFEILGSTGMTKRTCPGTGHANMQKWNRRMGVMTQ